MSRTNPAFLYPPDPAKSLRHRKANQIFKGLTPSDTQTCQCCGRRLASNQSSSSFCIDPDQLSFLGPGIPLFFFYLRMTILLLLTMSILFTSFALYSNLSTNDCSSLQVCSSNIMNLMSLINKRSNELYFSLQGFFELGFIIVVVLFFQGMRLYGRKLEKQCDQVINSPSDYAVILRRLPPETCEKDVMEMIEQRRKTLTQEQVKMTENLKVVKVVLSYSLREYLSVGNQNTQSFKTAIKTGQYPNFTPKPQPHPTIPSSIAVVIFQHQASKDLLIHRPSLYQRILQALCTPCIPISELTVKGVPIGVERAPEPDDICWQNSGITMGGGILRKILYGSLAFFILLLGGGAQYGLEVLYNSTTDSTLQTLLTASNSIVILIFNSIIMLTLIATTHKERNQTLTEYQSVLMTKQTIFQFFNAGLFVIGSEVAAKYDRFSLNDGICMQISAIMLANCFVPTLTLFLLTYTEIVNKLQAALGEADCLKMTQQELNELYLGPAVDLPSKYAYILKIVWLTGLYAPLVPIVTVVAALGLSLNYLIQKLLFAKSYSVPNTVSSQTFQNAMELLQYFIITFAMGQLVVYFYFYSYKVEQIPLLTLITIFLALAIGLANLILPMRAINQAIFPLDASAKNQVRYSAIEEKFQVTYEMNNPAYKTERERKNVKDVLGLKAEGKEKETGMAVAMEMTSLFAGSLGESRQPLLKQAGGGMGEDGKGKGKPVPYVRTQKQDKESILGDILMSGSNTNGLQSAAANGDKGINVGNTGYSIGGNAGNQQGFNSLLQDLSAGKQPETAPSTMVKEGAENGVAPNVENVKDPRQELRSIKKQLLPNSQFQNQPSQITPIPNQNSNQNANTNNHLNAIPNANLNANPNTNPNYNLNVNPNANIYGNPNISHNPNPTANQPFNQSTNPYVHPNANPNINQNSNPNPNNQTANPSPNLYNHPNVTMNNNPNTISNANPIITPNFNNSPNLYPNNQVSNNQIPPNQATNQTPVLPPIPSAPIPSNNKSSLPSVSPANDSFFKRTITPPPHLPNNQNRPHNITEANIQTLQGEDGETINVSILEPVETRPPIEKKGPIRPLAIESNIETVPINTNNTNSSTKYKKPPGGFSRSKEFPKIQPETTNQHQPQSQNHPLQHPPNQKKDPNAGLQFSLLEEQPQQKRRNATIAKQKEQEQARQQQALDRQAKTKPPPIQPPQANLYDDAPIAINRPMVPLQTPNKDTPSTNGIYTPLVPCEEFKFQDPQKEKESRYDPHLIDSNDTPLKAEQRSYLNKEGIMKALGRPFTTFKSKMNVQSMTERSGKNTSFDKTAIN